MLKRRMIVSLLWRKVGIVQSRGFSHTNVVGDPKVAIECFNAWDADEIILLNVERDDASLSQFLNLTEYVSYHCFLPLTVGGWVTNLDRARNLVRHGADKIVINTEGFRRPAFIRAVSDVLGAQAVVASIDVRRESHGSERVYLDRGRQATDITPEKAAEIAAENGAGEIYITSIDRDGGLQGYDTDLIRRVVAATDLPTIASGGVGRWEQLEEGLRAGADAVSAANVFHFTEQSTRKAKTYLRGTDFPVR